MRFVNVNVAALRRRQAQRRWRSSPTRALALEALREALAGHRADDAWSGRAGRGGARRGRGEVARLVHRAADGRCPPGGGHRRRQRRRRARPASSCARRARCPATCTSSGARATRGKGYHVEYGYSCMGYEIPGGMGVKLAAPEREVFVLVGDGSYLMLPGRAGDRGRRGHHDRRRARRQPRLRVDRRAVALGRLGRLRHPLPARGERRAPLDAPSDGRGAAARCPSTWRPTPRASACACCARATIDELRARSRRRGATAARSPSTSRSTATRACPATRAGGTCRSPRSPTTSGARGARGVRARAARRSARYVETP